MVKPKIAVQTRMWGNDKIDQQYPEIFNQIIKAGYGGAECRYTIINSDEQRLRSYLSEHPLTLMALHAGLKQLDPKNPKEDLSALLDKMNQFSIPYLLISLNPQENMEQCIYWFEAAAKIKEQCVKNKIQLCYHNHAWEFMGGLDFFDKITGDYKIQLAADLAWVHRGGYNPTQFVDKYANNIRYVHIKDTKDEKWKELGQGEVDLQPVLHSVSSLNLPWWTVEQDDTDQEPFKSASISRNYLNRSGY